MEPLELRRNRLSDLQVLDHLQVGPVDVEPKQISTTYRVVRGEEVDEAVLTYQYDEPVFNPRDPNDLNLASMIGAQVALNYGLFCKEIEFRGHLDETDQKFLREMLSNTAREIYVKKLLEPNPFLVEEYRDLPVEKRTDYLQARITFETPASAFAFAGWPSSKDRFCILSSGGKDSLLTHGLLGELGCEAHPIFLNESGRHWFTAVNAHREFRRSVPNTCRVWTNSDRMFSWMLRNLTFIRPDFQSFRSDEYPIRLWTVAVFLFGALPIIRKRKIGRLLIGDEYDTTSRASHQGIPHYDGLYDQSCYFDHAMSRYFGAKGWSLTQHSILRPLSEFLIQKTLAHRYPELLILQVSCHAAHEEGGRMRPCGRCEKCRRIVGMLLAAEVDPEICGYRPDQVESIRHALAEKGVHQEAVAARHLAHLLSDKGLIPEPRIGKIRGRPEPEAVRLRFHDEKSPIDEVPLAIRKPLLAPM
jgi:hypothetical protein